MIQLSPAAVKEVKRLLSQQENSDVFMRLGVQEGGCCHWYYTLSFDAEIKTEDRVHEWESIRVIIREDHHPYLNGLVVDYSEDLMGGGFRFNNPNATQHCSCGNSFYRAET